MLQGALLGAGNIALRSHLRQWQEDPVLRAKAEIVAVADLAPANLAAVRLVAPHVRTYSSSEELLANERLHFCDICTPPHTRRQLVDAAARRGLAVLCEKPLACSWREALDIAAIVRDAGVIFTPCHQYRHSPQWATVAQWLPRLGRVHLVRYDVQRTEANPGNTHWQPTWRTDPALAGGGILFDHGAHIFYQMHALFGRPQRVQAVVRNLRHSGYGVEDSAFVCMDYGERLVWVGLTWAAARRRIAYQFIGEHGELSGDDDEARLDVGPGERRAFSEGLSRDSAHSEWYAPLMRGFIENVEHGTPAPDSLAEALFVMRLIELAYDSSRQGRALAWTDGNR